MRTDKIRPVVRIQQMTCVVPVADNGFAPTRPYCLSSLAYG